MKGGISTWLEVLWVKNMVCGQIKGAAGCIYGIHTCQEVGVYMTLVVDSFHSHQLAQLVTMVMPHIVLASLIMVHRNIPTLHPSFSPGQLFVAWCIKPRKS